MFRIKRWGPALCLVLTATAGLAPGVAAQEAGWRVVGGASQVWFGGGVTDTTGGGLRVSPTSTVAWSVGADHPVGGVRIGLGVSYLSAMLEVAGSGVRIVAEDTHLRQFEFAALLSVPLLRVGHGGAGFSLAAGPALDIWTATGSSNRTRFGALAVLQFAAPITPDLKLLASAAGSVSGSPFEADELPVDFEPSTLRTGRVGFGVRYAF